MTDPRPLVKPAASAASSSPSPEAIGPEAYTRWRATTLGAVTEALEQRLLHQLMGMVEGKRVLDLGCGDGLLTCALAAHGAYGTLARADRWLGALTTVGAAFIGVAGTKAGLAERRFHK